MKKGILKPIIIGGIIFVMILLCIFLKYKAILPVCAVAVVYFTFMINRKILRKRSKNSTDEITQYTLKDNEIAKLSEYFIDKDEKYISSLGNGYIMNYLINGSLSKGFSVVSNKRVYFRGSCFSGQGKSLRKTDEERTVDIKDITGSGFIYQRYIGILLGLFVALLALIGGIGGSAMGAWYEWQKTTYQQSQMEELQSTVNIIENSDKQIDAINSQIAENNVKLEELQNNLAELTASQTQEKYSQVLKKSSIYEILEGSEIEDAYANYYYILTDKFYDSSFYRKATKLEEGLQYGLDHYYYDNEPYYDDLWNTYYEIWQLGDYPMWNKINYIDYNYRYDSWFELIVPSSGSLYIDYMTYLHEDCFLSDNTLREVYWAEEIIDYTTYDLLFLNGYLDVSNPANITINYEKELEKEFSEFFQNAYIDLLESIAPAYMESIEPGTSFEELVENTPSLLQIVLDYPYTDYASVLGIDDVTTQYDSDIIEIQEAIATIEKQNEELENELSQIKELNSDKNYYENQYNSAKKETFSTFMLSAIATAAAGLLITFMISCFLVFLDYLKKRKTMFQIQYAGGCIAFDVSFYAKAEIEDFQKQLRRAKDFASETSNVKTIAVETPVQTSASNSIPDELRKYGDLLKEGLISQEDYDAMKKKILGL